MIERMIERSCDRTGGDKGRWRHEPMIKESLSRVTQRLDALESKRRELRRLRAHKRLTEREKIDVRCLSIDLECEEPFLREQQRILRNILATNTRIRKEMFGPGYEERGE